MLTTIKKFKMPIIIVVVLIVVFIIYSYFKGGSNPSSSAVVTTTGSSNGAALGGSTPIGQAFINQLLTLQNVKLDTSIFSNPHFQSLKDFSQPIPEEPQGRPNPFAPIGVDVANGPSTVSGVNGINGVTFDSATTTATTSNSKTASSSKPKNTQ